MPFDIGMCYKICNEVIVIFKVYKRKHFYHVHSVYHNKGFSLARMEYSQFYFILFVLLHLSVSEARTNNGFSYYPRTKGWVEIFFQKKSL